MTAASEYSAVEVEMLAAAAVGLSAMKWHPFLSNYCHQFVRSSSWPDLPVGFAIFPVSGLLTSAIKYPVKSHRFKRLLSRG